MASTSSQIINFAQLKRFIDEKSIYLVDVREEQELMETGILPNSVNIPLAQVESALQLPDDQFKNKYDTDKPDYDTKIVFSCRSGKRSDMAMQIALKLGFKNALNYGGGWLDWEKNTKDCSR